MSAYISRTPGSDGNRRTWTFSAWVKRGAMADNECVFSQCSTSTYNSNTHFRMRFGTTHNLQISAYTSDWLFTNRLFRDPTAWYHIVLAVDTTNATADQRARLYINGVEETSFSTRNNPAEDFDTGVNLSGSPMLIGADDSSAGAPSAFILSNMSNINFVDGTQLTPSAFGETDATDGMWKIKTSPSVTYGTNGFFLKGEDSSNLDLDSGTNAFTFTTTGTLTATKDNPSNNFATWNPLVKSDGLDSPTFLNGNTYLQAASNTPKNYAVSSVAMPRTGKYFSEHKIVTNNDVIQFGIVSTDQATERFQSNTNFSASTEAMMYFCPEGKITYNNVNQVDGITTAGNNDIVGLAIDMDNEKMYIYVNGALANSGGTSFTSKVTGNFVYMCTGDDTSSGNDSVYSNFGNGYFGTTAISSAGTNASNNGSFEYDVPAGFGALCTKQINS